MRARFFLQALTKIYLTLITSQDHSGCCSKSRPDQTWFQRYRLKQQAAALDQQYEAADVPNAGSQQIEDAPGGVKHRRSGILAFLAWLFCGQIA